MSQHLVYHFKISLLGVYPLVWRRFKVNSKTPLSKFHTIIQCFMGWEHFHLYKFEYKWQCFEYDGNCSPSTTLEELNMVKGSSLNYSYDFGDNWEHTLELEKIIPKIKRERVPYCLDGKRACPPEDCGGPWGYKHYLSALKSKKGSKYRDAVEIIGRHFDPKKFDKSAVNKEIFDLLRDE